MGRNVAICPVPSHLPANLCFSGKILSGNLLAKHLAINTQPRVDGGSQTVKSSTPGSCRPCHAACCSPPASSASASGGAGGPILRGPWARERSCPGPSAGGLSGCPSGGAHVLDRLWGHKQQSIPGSPGRQHPVGMGGPGTQDSNPTQPGGRPRQHQPWVTTPGETPSHRAAREHCAESSGASREPWFPGIRGTRKCAPVTWGADASLPAPRPQCWAAQGRRRQIGRAHV